MRKQAREDSLTGTAETEYPLLRARKSVPLRRALCQLRRERGVEIFADPENLKRLLSLRDVSEMEIAQAYLFSQAGGFRKLTLSRVPIEKAELDRFLSETARETGLRRDAALHLTRIFLNASGRQVRFAAPMRHEPAPASYPAPRPAYGRALETFRKAYQNWKERGADIPEEAVAALQPWLAAGLPEAQYLMGEYLLKRAILDPSLGGAKLGVELLEEAVNSGDALSAAALGDYYYAFQKPKFWKTAVRYYTGYASPALTKIRRDRLLYALREKRRNGDCLRVCFFLLCFFVLLFGPVGWLPVFPVSLVSVPAILTECGVFLFTAVRWRFGNPYGDFYWKIPFFMTLTGLFFLGVRLLHML